MTAALGRAVEAMAAVSRCLARGYGNNVSSHVVVSCNVRSSYLDDDLRVLVKQIERSQRALRGEGELHRFFLGFVVVFVFTITYHYLYSLLVIEAASCSDVTTTESSTHQSHPYPCWSAGDALATIVDASALFTLRVTHAFCLLILAGLAHKPSVHPNFSREAIRTIMDISMPFT
jgi:hypothetical protein